MSRRISVFRPGKAPLVLIIATLIGATMAMVPPIERIGAESPQPFVRSWSVSSYSWGLEANLDGSMLVATDTGVMNYTGSGALLGMLTSSAAWDVAVDSNGNAYVVTDSQLIKLTTPDGTVSAMWPYGGVSVALDEARGLIYVHQFATETVLKLSMAGALLGQWSAYGVGIDVASDGSVLVAGYAAHDVSRYSPDGALVDRWIANPDGDIFAIAAASDGTIYTADSGAGHDIRKFSSDGSLLTQWGTRCENLGSCGPTEFGHLRGITVDCAGDVFASDPENGRIVQFGSGAGCQTSSSPTAFVTGAGWVDSLQGAYVPDPSLTGKATFGFVAKHKRGSSIPAGNTEFHFRVGHLAFKSSEYQSLTVDASTGTAGFEGTGTIDGAGGYGFTIWAVDGRPDTLRIKIWEASTTNLIYDNHAQALAGGSIVIHRQD